MIGHDHPGAQVVVSKLNAASQRIHDNLGNVFPAQVHWANSGCIQVTIHPNKGFSSPEPRGRIPVMRQAALQAPGYEEPLAFRIDVREPATSFGHIGEVASVGGSSHKQVCDGKSAVAAGRSACAT